MSKTEREMTEKSIDYDIGSGKWPLRQVNSMLPTISRFVIEVMGRMTKQERGAFLDTMASAYCMECYGQQPKIGICQCGNDE